MASETPPRRLRPEAIVRLGEDAHVATDLAEEREMHADVIEAVSRGWLTLDPDGAITPTTKGLHEGAVIDAPETTGGRVAALRAMGIEMKPIPSALRQHARQMLAILELIAGSNEGPAEWIERAEKLRDLWLVGARTGVDPWMLALEAVMSVTAPTERGGTLGPRDPVGAARDVLGKLRATCEALPVALVSPSEESLRDAGKGLLAARVRRVGKAGGRGGLVSPWAAARDFAQHFGVSMPDSASDANRAKKSKRRRNTPR